MTLENINPRNVNIQKNNFYSRAIEITTIILTVLIPVMFYPYLIRIFNPPKELLYELLVLICLALWGFRLTDEGKLQFITTPLNLPVLGFILICILSLLWSVSPSQSLLELPLFLAGLVLFFVLVNNIESQEQVHHILAAVLIVGSVLGIYGILQYLGIDFAFWKANIGRNQVFGLFGNVNYFAEYLIIPLTVAVPLLFAVRKKLVKILLLIGIMAMGTALLLTFTRGSYLGFAIALIFMFFLLLLWEGKYFFKKYRKIVLYFLLIVVAIALIVIIPNPLNEKGTAIYKIKERTSLTRLTQDSSIARRIAIWKFTGLMIKDNPALGSGLGTYPYHSLRYQAQFFAQADNRSIYPYGIAAQAHNEYLQLWAELGIIGLLIFLWIVARYYKYAFAYLKREKEKQKQIPAMVIGLMGGVMAVLVDALFGFPLHLPASVSLFWLAIALTVVVIERESYDKTKIRSDLSGKQKKDNTAKKYKENAAKKKNLLVKFKYLIYLTIIVATVLVGFMLIRPLVAEVHEFYALQNIEREDFDRAIKHYEETLKWNPYSGMAYFNLGQILAQRGLNTVAIEYFEKAAKFMDHPDLPENLAYLYIRKGMLAEAIPKLEQAILYQEKEKDRAPLYSDLGKLYLQSRKYSDAEVAFRNALKIDNKKVDSHLGLAVALLNQNKKEEALKELDKVIELAPDSQEAEQARDLLQQIARERLKAPVMK